MMETQAPMFNVFYRDYNNDVSISSSQPEPLAADRIAPMAEKLLVCEDNFLGIVDAKDVVLQVYCNDAQTMVMELLYPEASGCMQLKCSIKEALQTLGSLPEEFSEALLPGSTYIG